MSTDPRDQLVKDAETLTWAEAHIDEITEWYLGSGGKAARQDFHALCDRFRSAAAHGQRGAMDGEQKSAESAVQTHGLASLVSAARLALRYLDHPEVRALHFALPAESAARRLAGALEPFGGPTAPGEKPRGAS